MDPEWGPVLKITKYPTDYGFVRFFLHIMIFVPISHIFHKYIYPLLMS